MSFWKDKNVASVEIHHTVKHNNLKNEFVITRSEDEGSPIVVDRLSEAMDIMAKVENLPIAELKNLEKNQT